MTRPRLLTTSAIVLSQAVALVLLTYVGLATGSSSGLGLAALLSFLVEVVLIVWLGFFSMEVSTAYAISVICGLVAATLIHLHLAGGALNGVHWMLLAGCGTIVIGASGWAINCVWSPRTDTR